MMSAGSATGSASSSEELALIYREAHRVVARDESRRKLWTYYPDSGPLRRELYPKHLQFFAAGAAHRERLFMAANRVGKTEGVGGYETTLHLTGEYPPWWEGWRGAGRGPSHVRVGQSGNNTNRRKH